MVRSIAGGGRVRSTEGGGIVRSIVGAGIVRSPEGVGMVRSIAGGGIVRSNAGSAMGGGGISGCSGSPSALTGGDPSPMYPLLRSTFIFGLTTPNNRSISSIVDRVFSCVF